MNCASKSFLTETSYIVSQGKCLQCVSSHIFNATQYFYNQVGIQQLQNYFSLFYSLEPMLAEPDTLNTECRRIWLQGNSS